MGAADALALGTLIAAPYVLAFALLGLFFRAPLAALIGTAFTALQGFIGWQVTIVAAQGAHPVGSGVTFAGHPLATAQPAQMGERDAA